MDIRLSVYPSNQLHEFMINNIDFIITKKLIKSDRDRLLFNTFFNIYRTNMLVVVTSCMLLLQLKSLLHCLLQHSQMSLQH